MSTRGSPWSNVLAISPVHASAVLTDERLGDRIAGLAAIAAALAWIVWAIPSSRWQVET